MRLRTGFEKHKKEIKIQADHSGLYIVIISLGKRKLTRISLSDIGILQEHSFYAHKRGDGKYVARSSQTGEYLHRLLLQPPDNLEIDHVNADPLDNTRGNLRICTAIQNNLAKEQQAQKCKRGYAGVVQTRWAHEEQCYKKGSWVTVSYKEQFRAVSPSGVLKGKFRTEKEAAEHRDYLMMMAYRKSSRRAVFHDYGFMHWNVTKPKKAKEMDDWLLSEYMKAYDDGARMHADIVSNGIDALKCHTPDTQTSIN